MFDKKDIIQMAKELLDEETAFDYYGGDYGWNGYTCNYCGTPQQKRGHDEHTTDCTYLVAKDVMTRN